MKKLLTFILVAFFAFALVACGDNNSSDSGNENEGGNTSTDTTSLPETFTGLVSGKKVYLATAGQADLDTVKNIMKRVGLTVSTDATADVEQNSLLDADSVPNGAVVFLTVGGSNKGITGAGSSKEAEEARASRLASRATAGEITLIVCHVGGAARRGTLSDSFIFAAAPYAQLVLATADGNTDNYFSNLSNPHLVVSKSADLVDVFKQLFNIK